MAKAASRHDQGRGSFFIGFRRARQSNRASTEYSVTWLPLRITACTARMVSSETFGLSQRNSGPTLYPVACLPQAWASATPFSLVEAALGLEFDPRQGEIRLRQPRLPAFLDEVTLRNLQLGRARADIKVRRHRDDVSLEILRAEGAVQVSIIEGTGLSNPG